MRNLHRGYQPLITVIAAAETGTGAVMSQPQASFHMGWSSHDLHNAVFHSVPKILVFLLLLTIGWFAASAAIVAVALGVSAALDQAGITAAVREPVLYTVLLTCGAILAIGIGGGLIRPLQARWERMLAAAEPAAEQSDRTEVPGSPPGPRYLQSFSFSPGPGYLQNPGLPAEPGFQDDPVNYPGGQYM